MRVSQFPLFTLKEVPATAEVVSHRYMLRSGMIHRAASGLYTWLPLGLRVLRKVETVVREEMNAAGAIEMLMPTIQPAELWQASGRWDDYGPELLRITDRHQRDFVFGPTHEEVITDIAAALFKSYRQLPVNFYQIQTKFRDEIRPRFGVMRAREFTMKDAYSFHADETSLDETYRTMFDAYSRIFTRLGLNFRAVAADTGLIGGSVSHEFQVLAESGENAVVFSESGDYAANVELAPCPPPPPRAAPTIEMDKIATPDIKTIDALSAAFDIPHERSLKAVFVKGEQDERNKKSNVVGLFIRGDHRLNAVKAAAHPLVASPLEFASPEDILAAVGCPPGSLGPVNLSIPYVVDETAAAMSDFACGANEAGYHYTGVNWGRDTPEPQTADLRDIHDGEAGPGDCGPVRIKRGIEVGHIFKLGSKYSEKMEAGVLTEDGRRITMTMGCYGIGVSRIVAAAIEQNHDDDGIIWPAPMAPFEVVICPMGYARDDKVRACAEQLRETLDNAGIETLLDDRDTRAGAMFADADLIGIPLRVVIGKRGLAQDVVECKRRDARDSENLPVATCHEVIIERVRAARKAQQ